jgi:hypothetical protein
MEPDQYLRYIDHPYAYELSDIALSAKLGEFDAKITEMLKLSKSRNLNINIGLNNQEENSKAHSMEVIDSRGKKFVDPFIYLGTGGNILMYYRLYLSAIRT